MWKKYNWFGDQVIKHCHFPLLVTVYVYMYQRHLHEHRHISPVFHYNNEYIIVLGSGGSGHSYASLNNIDKPKSLFIMKTLLLNNVSRFSTCKIKTLFTMYFTFVIAFRAIACFVISYKLC